MVSLPESRSDDLFRPLVRREVVQQPAGNPKREPLPVGRVLIRTLTALMLRPRSSHLWSSSKPPLSPAVRAPSPRRPTGKLSSITPNGRRDDRQYMCSRPSSLDSNGGVVFTFHRHMHRIRISVQVAALGKHEPVHQINTYTITVEAARRAWTYSYSRFDPRLPSHR